MIRLLQSSWMAGILGTVSFVATMAAVWKPQAQSTDETEAVEAAPRTQSSAFAYQNPELDLLIEELKKEKAAVAAREKALGELATRLESERTQLMQLTQVVQQAQAEFDLNVTRVREEETANLKKLSKMYTTMSPEAAAMVFKSLDDSTVIKVLTVTKDADRAAILEALARQSAGEAKRVATLSERLRLAFAETKKPAQ